MHWRHYQNLFKTSHASKSRFSYDIFCTQMLLQYHVCHTLRVVPSSDILFSPLFSLETELSFLSKNPYRTRKAATDSERQFGNLAKTFRQKIKHPIFHSNRYLLCQRPYICHFTPRLNVEVYSGVRNRRPPRQLIFQKFSTQDILIPTPPEIKFWKKSGSKCVVSSVFFVSTEKTIL